jgi:uncharacterized protein (DUF1499 family)
MLRQPYVEIPKSRLAVWSGRLALFALIVAALSVIILRLDLLEIGPALATFAAALGFAIVAMLLAFASFVPIWRQGLGGLRHSIEALLVAIVLLAYPGYLAAKAYKLPPINDITTDAVNPPRFDVLARLRAPGTSDYPGRATAELQQAAYPDVSPLEVTASAKDAYDSAIKVITKRKWRIVDAQAPAPSRNGVIEAVARTTIMGFRDDVVIRITAVGPNATRIDMRSASRYGKIDFGANAARVSKLLDDIDDEIDSIPEPKPEAAPAKKPPAQPPKRAAPAPKR